MLFPKQDLIVIIIKNEVMVIATAIFQLDILIIDPLPDWMRHSEIKGGPADIKDFTAQAITVTAYKAVCLNLQQMGADIAAALTAQIIISVISDVANRILITDCAVYDFQLTAA